MNISDEDQSSSKCQVHKGMPLIALFLNELKDCQKVLCSKCIKRHNIDCKELVFFDDILNSDENTIFENWPLQSQNGNLLQELQQLIENDEDRDNTMSPSLVIQLFFDDFQRKVSEMINNSMKRILAEWENIFITKEKLLEIYNSLSQKQKLKEYILSFKNQKQNSIQDIDALIFKMITDQKDNSQVIKQNLDLYKKTKEKLHLKLPKYYMQQTLNQIENIEEYFFEKDAIFIQDQPENDSQFFTKSQKTSELLFKLISNKSNFCNEKFLGEVKSFLNQVSSGLNKISIDSLYFRNKQPIDFSELNQPQFDIIEDQINCLVKINNQFKKYQGFIDYERIQKIQEDLVIKQGELYKYNENFINEYQINHMGEIDKTFVCNFSKSKYDQYSLTNQTIRRDSTNRIEIKQIKSGWQVQSCLDEVIEPSKKYILRISFEPFPSHLQNYRIYIGIIEEREHESKWLDSSPFLFSNNPRSGFSFNKVKKGLNINDNSIRYERKMRFLEFQMCLADKHFLISDYPEYSNITEAESEKFDSFSIEKTYKLLIESESVQKIRIYHFSEVKEFPSL